MPTACGSWRRVGKAEVEEKLEEEDEEERRKRRRRTTVIKSNNPHLAGGEIHGFNFPSSTGCKENYFTSCDPHHDIYTFCYWQIFWHSI